MNSRGGIVFVLPAGLTLSGVTTWVMTMARHLAESGQAVGLIQHAPIPPLLDINIPAKIALVKCQNQAFTNGLYTQTDLLDYLADYQQLMPGIVIPNGQTGPYATCALMSKQSPDLLRVIGVAHADEHVYYDWLEYYEPIIHKFVAVSQEVANNLSYLMPHRQPDIQTKPYAVEVDHNLQRPYSAQAEPLQLLYAGRMIEQQKRVSDLVRLVEFLLTKGVNFHLRLAGDGPDVERMVTGIRNLGGEANRRVSFVGRISPAEMPSVWQTADICILASEYEGTSVSMLEAMAAGCVPVVTQVSGTAAVIQSGVNGYTVPVGAMAQMAGIIQKLEADRAQLVRLGVAAYTTVVENYSYEHYIPWFLNLVEEAWQQPPRRWPEGRPLHRHPLLKERLEGLSGEQLSRLVSTRKLVKALGFQTARHPAFKWLYRFRGIGKKLLGG